MAEMMGAISTEAVAGSTRSKRNDAAGVKTPAVLFISQVLFYRADVVCVSKLHESGKSTFASPRAKLIVKEFANGIFLQRPFGVDSIPMLKIVSQRGGLITRSDSQWVRAVGRTFESAMLRCVQGRGSEQPLALRTPPSRTETVPR